MFGLDREEVDHIELSIRRSLSLMRAGEIDYKSIVNINSTLYQEAILVLESKEL